MQNAAERSDFSGAWTFIETLIVIAIVLVLSSSVGFMAIKHVDRAKTAAARSQIDTFCVALESYYIDCGRYPSNEQGLGALWEKPVIQPISENWMGPYINKKIPKDPWDNDYEYRSPGNNNLPFSIRSFGADKKEGGEGNDADITSWE